MRNIGGSIGIASVTTLLERGAQVHQTYLGANLPAGASTVIGALHGLQQKFAADGFDEYDAHRKALGAIFERLEQQASLLAYADNFRLLAALSLLCVPLALLFQRVRKQNGPQIPGE
jgi:DHA2 family multidrug resistance protein